MIQGTYYDSPIGRLFIAAKDEQLIGLWIEGQKYYLSSIKEKISIVEDSAILSQTRTWLDRYFCGECPDIHALNLAPQGSDFRKQVWQILIDIPYGQTITYQEIAQKIAQQKGLQHMSAQAVGGAVGHNPISIIIPCHRVIGTNGSLTGYAGGIKRKLALLELEGHAIDEFKIPQEIGCHE